MQPLQCSLLESEAQKLRTADPAHPAVPVADKQTSRQTLQSDRQPTAEALYAAFVWLFGPGCY